MSTKNFGYVQKPQRSSNFHKRTNDFDSEYLKRKKKSTILRIVAKGCTSFIESSPSNLRSQKGLKTCSHPKNFT
jgi:hypothetical protein